MSINPDNLTLWGNYSKNDGYNIGFNLSLLDRSRFSEYGSFVSRDEKEVFLSNINNETHELTVSGQLDLLKVQYDEREHENEIRNYCEGVNRWYIANKDNMDKVMASLAICPLTDHIYNIARCYKKEVFTHEEEIRMIITLINNDVTDKILFHREKENIVIPYIRLKNKELLPIHSISVGPTNRNDKAIDGIKSLLAQKKYQYNIKIYQSSAPLRF